MYVPANSMYVPSASADESSGARCALTAADGRYEPYKVSLRYDNPMTR